MSDRMTTEDCRASIDGWCKTHSTGDGPVWCVDALKLAVRRARFHEQENYQRAIDAEARADRNKSAWRSARNRAVGETPRATSASPPAA